MLLQQAKPGNGLDHWVHSYRQYSFAPSDNRQFTCLPGTGAELWLLHSGKLSHSGEPLGDGLLCLRSRRLEFRQTGLRVFAIRFRAGSLPFFTCRPLTKLVDHFTPVNALWDAAAVQQLGALHCSPNFAEQCLLAERFLYSRLRAGDRLEHMQQMATAMYEQSADFVLGDYAEKMHRDRSYLSRQFRDIHGTSAKHYHRLCRFERFLRDALFAAKPSLAGLAVDHGYYDQAHMNNEVRQLSHQSPRVLLAQDETRLFYSQRFNPSPKTSFSYATSLEPNSSSPLR